jgi:hypothetical protein
VTRVLVLVSLCLSAALAGKSAPTRLVRSVPLCAGVTLSASYLALVNNDQGPGFRFKLVNNTSRTIRLVEPVPSSSHWYARANGRWLWRASNGAGGSLLDAGNERGRVVVYPPPADEGETRFLTLAPHASQEWVASQRENAILAYQPGCKMCSYPGEREYQAVFAYAYLAAGAQPGLLACGLRTAPVPMPPKF